MQFGKHDREIPASKPGGPEACIFSYQTGRLTDLVDCGFETASFIEPPPAPTEPGELPERSIIPPSTERYLFILTPNAPPLAA